MREREKKGGRRGAHPMSNKDENAFKLVSGEQPVLRRASIMPCFLDLFIY